MARVWLGENRWWLMMGSPGKLLLFNLFRLVQLRPHPGYPLFYYLHYPYTPFVNLSSIGTVSYIYLT